MAWASIWTGLVASWWSDNAAGGGWVGPGFITAVAVLAVAGGLAVIGVVVLFSRFALVRQRGRWIVLVGVPVALLVWLLGSYLASQPRYYDANTFPTGLIVEELPEGYARAASLYSQRGDFDVLESTTTSGELLVGTVDPRPANPTEDIVRQGDVTFHISTAGERTRVRRALGPVDIELESNELSVDALMSISAGARYDPDWDVRD